MRKIVIVGAGAVGKCLAALLAGRDAVTVYERDPVIRRALKKNRFIVREGGRARQVKVSSAASLADLRGEKLDVLVFATKIMDLRRAVTQAAGLDPRCVLLPQNGIFDIRWAERSFKTADVCRGVTTMACQSDGPLRATLFHRGTMYIGGDGAARVAGLFRERGLDARACDPAGAVWAKLIFSSVMNPLPVITGRGYDVLKNDPAVWDLVRRAVAEGRAVARALGVRLAFDPLPLIHRVRDGDLAGIAHRGTISQDMRAGRSTEIDFITSAVVRQARKSGVPAPAMERILAMAKTAGA